MESYHQRWRIIYRHSKKSQGSFEVLIYEAVLGGVYREPWRPCVRKDKKGNEVNLDVNYLRVARLGRRMKVTFSDAEFWAVICLEESISHRSVATTTSI